MFSRTAKISTSRKKPVAASEIPRFGGDGQASSDLPYPDVAAAVIASNANMRLMLAVSWVVLVLLSITLAVTSKPGQGQFFTVQSKTNGEAVILPAQAFKPEIDNIKFYIAQTIEDAWLINSTAMDKPNRRALARYVGNARTAMQELWTTDNPYELLKANSAFIREAEVGSVTITGDIATIRFVESRYPSPGAKPIKRKLSAQVQFQIKPSPEPDQRRDNPIGLLITSLNLSIEKE